MIKIIMQESRKPAEIHFFEEEPRRAAPLFSSKLTRFVRTISFGLIKNDTQAGIVVILFTIAAIVAAYYYIQENKGVEPTQTYELLPQESVGSSEGLPPNPSHE